MATDHEQTNDETETNANVYSRVSAAGQTAPTQLDLQKREVEHFAEEAGALIVAWYVDAEFNGRDA